MLYEILCRAVSILNACQTLCPSPSVTAAFGKVLEGLDVLERLSNLPVIADGDDEGAAAGGPPRANVRVLDSGVLAEGMLGAWESGTCRGSAGARRV